jgi:hypothetical protein
LKIGLDDQLAIVINVGKGPEAETVIPDKRSVIRNPFFGFRRDKMDPGSSPGRRGFKPRRREL